MDHEFKVTLTWRRKREESGPIVGPDAHGMAARLASHWIATRKGRVSILRADTAGINAGKFFLHQIVKS